VRGGLTPNTDFGTQADVRVLEARIRELVGSANVELRWDKKQVVVWGIEPKRVEHVAAKVLRHPVRVVVLSSDCGT